MSTYYRTNEGDQLDWICWNYYIRKISLGSAAMAVDPRVLSNDMDFRSGFLLNGTLEKGLRGTVEFVLNFNPGLAEYPLYLPEGLQILLPDFDQKLVENTGTKLWE